MGINEEEEVLNRSAAKELESKTVKTYTACILKRSSDFGGKKNSVPVPNHFQLSPSPQGGGSVPKVLPIDTNGEAPRIGIFAGTPDEVRIIMDRYPGVQAGLFTYELHDCRGLPGSTLLMREKRE
jgi:hypothetical protein